MATVVKRPGSPNWFARFQIDGQDYTITTGTASKREAERIMHRMVAEKKGHVSVGDWFDGLIRELENQTRDATTEAKKREILAMRQDMARQLAGGQREKLPVKEAWQAWLNSPRKRNPGPVTIQQYEAEWGRFSRWATSRRVVFFHDVTVSVAESYSEDLWKSGVAPGTYNAHINFMKSMFRVLSTKAGLVSNPWAELPTMPSEREGRRMLSPDELTKLCKSAKGSFRYMIGIGLYTGMRLGDVVNLCWEAIHSREGFIEITPLKTKRLNKKVRLPIHPVLDALLNELRRTSKSEFLFAAERQDYLKDRGGPARAFGAFVESCGIKTTEPASNGHRKRVIVRVGFHSLRHSFVSLCAANRIPQVAIMDLVGHGSPAMTALYTHAGDEQKIKAIATLPTFSFTSTPQKDS